MMMINFITGVGVGLCLASFLYGFVERRAAPGRHGIDMRLKYLERHLCCGKGYFGCDGGPKCTSDHK